MIKKIQLRWFVAVMILALPATAAQAAISIHTVGVENVGNANDTRYDATGYGGVNYAYSIGTYEVTAGQYTEFLNAVAVTDAYGLYNDNMWDLPAPGYGCMIAQAGSSGSFSYTVAADRADRPVNYVSWADAARFANWLHNGQPTGAQGLTTTENGAYYLNGTMSEAALMAVNREADWEWALPTEDEWYKAAYHKNDGATGNYFLYPTSSDDDPSGDLVDPDPGNNATFVDPVNGDTIGTPYWRTEVGDHENSGSPYGTFDQGGNSWEMSESAKDSSSRSTRGGACDSTNISYLTPTVRLGVGPNDEWSTVGFRVAHVSLPTMGDANGDGKVDEDDAAVLAANWLSDTDVLWSNGDFNGDGTVDATDATLMAANWGYGVDPGAAVPEPSTLVLLSALSLGLFLRRRNTAA